MVRLWHIFSSHCYIKKKKSTLHKESNLIKWVWKKGASLCSLTCSLASHYCTGVTEALLWREKNAQRGREAEMGSSIKGACPFKRSRRWWCIIMMRTHDDISVFIQINLITVKFTQAKQSRRKNDSKKSRWIILCFAYIYISTIRAETWILTICVPKIPQDLEMSTTQLQITSTYLSLPFRSNEMMKLLAHYLHHSTAPYTNRKPESRQNMLIGGKAA